MNDPALADLNFRALVDYGGQPPVRNRYSPPLECFGYCVACETEGAFPANAGCLDLMSHGCDSSDFEILLGPRPTDRRSLSVPVLFLLENPGSEGRYSNGRTVHFNGFAKKPPVNHYYWTPNGSVWPTTIAEFVDESDFYGRYFAYLMYHHALANVYITNITKCRWRSSVRGLGKTPEPAAIGPLV